MKSYEVDGKKYKQKPLTPYQLVKLLDIFDDMKIENIGEMKTVDFIRAFAARMGDILAIILIKEDGAFVEIETADELQKTVGMDVLVEMIEDFFTFNGIIQLFGMMSRIKVQLPKSPVPIETKETGLSKPAGA